MGAGQSHSVASNHKTSSIPRRQEAYAYDHSPQTSPSSFKSRRHHAVRYRESSAAAPNSRREFLQQQQKLVQEDYFVADVASHDSYLAREDHLAHAVAQVPGYFYNDGSAIYGDAGATLQRTHAVRTGTAPTPRDASRRKVLITGERERRKALGKALGEAPIYYHAKLSQPPYSTPHYMVSPRPAGHARVSRFREEF